LWVEGLWGNTIVYKKFEKPGTYEITLEHGNQKLRKSIRILDSFKFGNGKSLGLYFFRNRNIIIQNKYAI